MPAVAAFPVPTQVVSGYTIQRRHPGEAIVSPSEGVWGMVYLDTDRDAQGVAIVETSLPSTTMAGVGTTRYAAHALGVPSRDDIYLQIALNGVYPARITLPLTVGNKSVNESLVEYTQLDLTVQGRMITLTSKDDRWHIGNYSS